MATEKQIAAAANAAQHSTGPKSTAGRGAVSYNRLSHGLTSKRVILPGEDAEAFQKLLDDFMADLHPVDLIERTMVQQIAENYWRLDRARGIETATFQIEARKTRADIHKSGMNVENCGPDELHSLIMRNSGHHFELMRRYEGSIERAYYRAVKEFQLYRANRLKQQPQPAQQVTNKKRFESQTINLPSYFPVPDTPTHSPDAKQSASASEIRSSPAPNGA
jgi:hypothetical protein